MHQPAPHSGIFAHQFLILDGAPGIEDFIAPSHLGNQAGLVGALTLAEQALLTKARPSCPTIKRLSISAELLSVVLLVAFSVGVGAGKLLRR